jgi:2-polyprenyl-6-methoxyphenol hydroxylase-like FAD-dependent oxidoreductase
MKTHLNTGTDGYDQPADVIIIGGGLSGTLAAILLARQSVRVTLIDPHDVFPPEFRAEQLVGDQVQMLSRLGLLEALAGSSTPAGRAVATRRGCIVGVVTAPHYGIRYDDMVNRARRHLPASVQVVRGKVVDIEVSPDRQTVRLSNGAVLQARLVMLATGLGQRLLAQLGIVTTTVRESHSLTFGFDINLATPQAFADTVLVSYGERQSDCIDYITIFSIDDKLRANLFSYGDYRDALVKSLMSRPTQTLRAMLPTLEQTVGGLEVTGAVRLYVNHLRVATDNRREGVVLIGDAFQTPCPAAGTGIGRLLNDIDLLCNHYIPAWLATDGMGAGKISAFYDDPAKRNIDSEALRVAGYRRSLTLETTLPWRLHRLRVALQNQLRLSARRGKDSWTSAGMAPAA